MGSGALLAPALSRHSSSHELCLSAHPRSVSRLVHAHREEQTSFSSSLNLEKGGSFLVHFSVVLESVSQLSNCFLSCFHPLLISPKLFFTDMWHISA